MAVTPLSQAIMAGMDPSVYRPLSDLDRGDALTQAGMDASPTSKWGALGRVAQALAGTYISGGAQSDLAKTIAEGKKSAADLWIRKQLAAVPAATPRSMAPAPASQPQPSVQPNMPVQPQAETPAPPNPEGFDPEKFAEIARAQAARVDEPSVPLGAPSAAPAPTASNALAAPAAVPDAVAAVDRAAQPRGIRNNNPLNIEAGDFTKGQPGFAGSDGRFAKFETPEQGVAAANKLLDIYEQKHGLNTVAGIINRWAPANDGNNVSAYAANVAGRLGIDPNAPIPKEMRPQLIAAMAQHENGKAAPGTVDAPYRVAGPAVAAPRGASPVSEPAGPATSADPSEGLGVSELMQVLHHPWSSAEEKALASKLLVQRLTPKEDEFASSPQGIFSKRTGDLKQGQNAGANDFGDLRGKDLLSSLEKSDPASAAQVRAIIEGRTAYPTGSRLNPVQQRIKELVTLVDPTFETGNSGARMKVRNEFMAGGPNTPAGQITAGNTAIQHLGHLLEASDKLGGASDWGPLNSTLNDVNVAIKGRSNDTGLVQYNNALGRFAEEATKFYRGVGGTEADIQRALADLTAAQSPEARRTAIKAQADLMASKINALQDRWKQGMGPLVDEFPIIHPESKQALEKISPPPGAKAQDTDKKAAGAGPQKISTQAEYDALPPGTRYIAPNGKDLVKGARK